VSNVKNVARATRVLYTRTRKTSYNFRSNRRNVYVPYKRTHETCNIFYSDLSEDDGEYNAFYDAAVREAVSAKRFYFVSYARARTHTRPAVSKKRTIYGQQGYVPYLGTIHGAQGLALTYNKIYAIGLHVCFFFSEPIQRRSLTDPKPHARARPKGRWESGFPRTIAWL